MSRLYKMILLQSKHIKSNLEKWHIVAIYLYRQQVMRIEWASKNVLFTCKLIIVNIKTVSGNLRFITLF